MRAEERKRYDYRTCQFIILNNVFEIKYKNEACNGNLLTKVFDLMVYYLLLTTGEEGKESEEEKLRE